MMRTCPMCGRENDVVFGEGFVCASCGTQVGLGDEAERLRDAVMQQVQAPASAMITLGLVTLLIHGMGAMMIAIRFALEEEHFSGAADDFTFLLTVVLLLVSLAVGSCSLVGGIQMHRLRRHRLAVVAVAISLLRTGLWMFGLAIGIWSLVVLGRPQVKDAFQSERP